MRPCSGEELARRVTHGVCLLIYISALCLWPQISWSQETSASENMVTEEPQPQEIATSPPEPQPTLQAGEDQGFAVMNSGSAVGVPADTGAFAEPSEDNEFIVELVARKDIILSAGMPVYLDENDVLVPLGLLAQAMQFPIKVDTATARAEGWFITPENTFVFEKPFKKAVIAGKEIELQGRAQNQLDDIFVSSKDIEKWFPIKLMFNFNELRLYLEPLQELPFEEKAARDSRWQRLQEQSKKDKEKDNYDDVIFLPYKKWSPPTFQISHDMNYTTSPADSSKTLTTSLQATNDLLGHAARLNGSLNTGDVTQKGISSVSFNLSKEDYRGNLLGRMKATEYELGDVDATPFPLADGSLRGRGAVVSNAPANFVRDINNFAVRGFGPVGWDAELFQDEQIIDFIRIGADGRYDFENIQLREGFNLFRIVLYGPNGEQEERFERFYLGQNMVEEGKFIYNLAGMESTAPLFNVDDQDEGTGVASMLGEYGLSDKVSLYGGLYHGGIGDGELNAFGSGLRLSSSRFYTQLSGLVDASGAYSGSVSTTGNISNNITVTGSHIEHKNYDAGLRSTVQETSLGFSQMFSFKFLQFGSYGFEGRSELSDTDVRTNIISNRISASFLGLNLTNEVERSKEEGSAQEAMIDGNLTMRYRSDIGLLRGRVNYALDNRDRLQSGEIGLQTNLTPDLFLNVGLNTQFTGTREKTLLASIDRQYKKFKLGFNGSVSTEDEIRLGMVLTYNLIPQLGGGYMMTGETQLLNSGTLELIPYLDANQDGQFNEGEQQIADVGFRNTLRGITATANDNGVAALEGLVPSLVNSVTIDVKTLPDIYMAPAVDKLRIFGKPGFSGPVYYPVTLFGEISGTLKTMGPMAAPVEPVQAQPLEGDAVVATQEAPVEAVVPPAESALQAIRLVLLDKDDKVVAETYTEYDGFFSFQSLPLGRYRVYVPAGSEIDKWFTGDRTGPEIAITADQTEVGTLEMTITPEAIVSTQ